MLVYHTAVIYISLFTFLLLHSGFAFSQKNVGNNFINPTGSYELVTNVKVENGDSTGYSGNIKVKLLANSKAAISFYVTKGFPSYSSGSFIDTLSYVKNQLIYQTDDDKTCKLTFTFLFNGVSVNEIAANYNSGCGFGHAVIANGFYRKISSKPPIIKDPLTD